MNELKAFGRGLVIALPFIFVAMLCLCAIGEVKVVSSAQTLKVMTGNSAGMVIDGSYKIYGVKGTRYYNRQQLPQDGDLVSIAIVEGSQRLAYGDLQKWHWRCWLIVHKLVEMLVWLVIYTGAMIIAIMLVKDARKKN